MPEHLGHGDKKKTYLEAELVVCRNNSHFNDSNYQYSTNHTQETEHVVVATLVLPEILKHKQQLNEEDCKGDQASQDRTSRADEIPWLGWDLARDGICLERVFPGLGSHVSNPATKIHKRDLDQEPESKQTNKSAEWNCCAGSLCPHKQVEDQDEEE